MYQIRATESGDVIDTVPTYYDAVAFIKECEDEDRAEGKYTPGFYEIYDEANQEIVTESPNWIYNQADNIMEMCAFDMGVSTENGQTTIVTVGYGCASYLTVDNERAIELAKFILETVGKESD